MDLQIGDTAPPFVAPEIKYGVPISLDAYLHRPVVVAFSGLSWCGPCMFEAPILEQLWQVAQQHVQFLMVSVNDQSDALLLNAVNQFGITFPVIRDEGLDIAKDWIFKSLPGGGSSFGVPHLFVLKPAPAFPDPPERHVVCAVHKGANGSEAELKAELEQLIVDCIPSAGHDGGYWEEYDPIPWLDPGPLRGLSPAKRDVLISLGIGELARTLGDQRAGRRIERLAADALQAASKRVHTATRQKTVPKRRTGAIETVVVEE